MFNKMRIFTGSSHNILATAITNHIGIKLGKATITKFSNENIKVVIQENVRQSNVFVIQTSTPPVSDNLLELLIMIDALRQSGAAHITAVLPYYPYARSDKRDEPQISITARLVADLLQTAGINHVLTMVLHAPQILGFFKVPIDHLSTIPIFIDYLKTINLDNTVVVSTDVGASKLTNKLAKSLNLPTAIINKQRYDDNESAHSTSIIGEITNKNIILFDDEIATGSSIKEATRLLYQYNAKTIKVMATHAIFSGNILQNLTEANVDEIIVTDTVPVHKHIKEQLPKLTILSTAGLFSEAITKINNGQNINHITN